MKRSAWFSAVILSIVVLALAATRAAAQQPGAVGPDSTQKLCKEMYQKNCSGCHGEKGQGVVGPNLTDKYWLHGGGAKEVARSITQGVSGKGMISWDAVLTAPEIKQLSEFVLAFQGSSPPKGKKPEGDLDEGLRN